jgi:hypothetical protein
MLRASAQVFGSPLNLAGISDLSQDPLIAGGTELLAFTTALVERDEDSLDSARSALMSSLGAAATARASAVTGNFEMMNRLLDATGVPASVDPGLAVEMGLSSNWPEGP